jgi:hypothetical protein
MFLTDPGLVPIPQVPDLWYLDGPLVWVDAAVRIVIPAGFISDDASVPKFLDWVPFLDRQGLSRRPGLMHDGLYSLGRGRGKDWCDLMLREACVAEGLTPFQAGCYYQGVHLFGGSSWSADAQHGIWPGSVVEGDFISQAAADAYNAVGATIFFNP